MALRARKVSGAFEKRAPSALIGRKASTLKSKEIPSNLPSSAHCSVNRKRMESLSRRMYWKNIRDTNVHDITEPAHSISYSSD